MARTNSSTPQETVLAQVQHTTPEVLVLRPDADGIVVVPSEILAAPIVYVKRGSDLLLEGANAAAVAVNGYFLADPPPVLIMPDGAEIGPSLLRAFLPPAGTDTAGEPTVAHVVDLTGEVFVIRPGQPPVRLKIGDPVYPTDTIQAGDDARLSLLFADGTSRTIGGGESVSLEGFGTAAPGQNGISGDSDISPAAGDAEPPRSTTQFTIVSGEVTITTQSGTVRLNQRGETVSVTNADGRHSETVVLSESDLLGLYGDLTYTVTTERRSDRGNGENVEDVAPAAGGSPQPDGSDGAGLAQSGSGAPAGGASFTILEGEITVANQAGSVRLSDRNATTSLSSADDAPVAPTILSDAELAALYGTVTRMEEFDSGSIEDEADRLNEIDTAAGGDPDAGGFVDGGAATVPGLVSPFRLSPSDLFAPPTFENEPLSAPAPVLSSASGVGESSSSPDDEDDPPIVSPITPNNAPLATAENAAATEDQPVTISAAALLANDTDPDGDSLNLASVQNAVNGTVSLDANGDVLFTPTADFNGTARFEYTVADGNGGSASATVTVTVAAVNDAPIALPASGSENEDTALTILASSLLANVTDPDGDPLNLASVHNAVNGTVSLDANGDVLFTPAADFNGTASFEYTAEDGNGGSASATVTVAIAAVNDAPLALPDSASTISNKAVTVPASALLSNDSDTEGDTLSLTSVQSAVNGTAALDTNGDVLFTPNTDFLGTATFEYTVSDGNGGTSSTTTTVQVDPPPSLSPDEISGLSLWLDGADPTSLQDTDGDGALNRWVDNSGEGHDVAAPSASQQPGLVDGANFDGADDVLAIGDAPDLNLAATSAEKTLTMVFTTDTDVTTRQVLYEQGGVDRGLNLYIENGQVFVGGHNLNETPWGPTHVSGTVAPDVVNSVILNFNAVAGTISGTLNGISLGNADGVDLLHAHRSDIGLGRIEQHTVFPDGPVIGDSLGFRGTIHEVAFFQKSLNEVETNALNNYYADKWSVAAAVADSSIAERSAGDTLTFGPGDDTIVVEGKPDTIFGGEGDDNFIADDLGFGHLDGGGGSDTFTLKGEGKKFDLRGIDDNQLVAFETIDFSGAGDNILVLNENVVLAITGEDNILRIDGNADDTVNAAGSWSETGGTTIGGTGYTVFTSDSNGATLQVDDAVAMNIG